MSTIASPIPFEPGAAGDATPHTAAASSAATEPAQPMAGNPGDPPPMRKLGAGEADAKPQRSRFKFILKLTPRHALILLTVAAVSAGAWYLTRQPAAGVPAPASAASGPQAAAAAAERAKAVAATVDGKPVMEVELAGLINSGADRAVALDRYINKVLAADAARSRYADDARTAVTAAEREILANLYLQRRNQELLQAVTDAQVADYYKANVRDEDYAAFKLRYYLSRDQADAVNVKALLDKADKGAQAKLAPLGNTQDGYMPFQAIPYGLGQVVRNAKAGDVIGPVMVRDGLLVLSLDEMRKGSKPELDKVRNEIRALLADRQLSEELLALRKKAQIQLN